MIRLAAFLIALAIAFPASAQITSDIVKPLTPTHVIGYSSASVAITSNFTAQTLLVRLLCTSAFFVQRGVSGSTPTATPGGVTSSIPLAANVPIYLPVSPDGKIAAIRLSSDGTLYVTEVDR